MIEREIINLTFLNKKIEEIVPVYSNKNENRIKINLPFEPKNVRFSWGKQNTVITYKNTTININNKQGEMIIKISRSEVFKIPIKTIKYESDKNLYLEYMIDNEHLHTIAIARSKIN